MTGVVRRAAEEPLGCSEHLRGRVELVRGELLEPDTLRGAIERVHPREIYHLAGPSFVPDSWRRPGETMTAIAGSCAAMLEAVREIDPAIRVFVPASGAMFGDASESPQREDTPLPADQPVCDRQACRAPARGRDARQPTAACAAPASSTTTSPSAGPSGSSPARSPTPPPRSASACSTS